MYMLIKFYKSVKPIKLSLVPKVLKLGRKMDYANILKDKEKEKEKEKEIEFES